MNVWAHIQGTGLQSYGTQSTISPVLTGVSAGDILVACCGNPSAYASSVTSSPSLTWNYAWEARTTAGGGAYLYVAYAQVLSAGTYTINGNWGAANYLDILVDEFSITSGATISVDTPTLAANIGYGTSVTLSGNVSPSGNDLMLGYVGAQGYQSFTAGTGYSLCANQFSGNYSNIGLCGVYGLNITTPTNPSANISASSYWALCAFGLLATGGGASFQPWLLGDQCNELMG